MNSKKVKEIKKGLEKYKEKDFILEGNKFVKIYFRANDILTLINELESENERLSKSDSSKEESSIEYYNLYKDLKRKNKDLNELCELQRVSIAESFVRENQLKDRIAELENLCNKTYEDLTKEIDRLGKENLRLANGITCQAVVPDDKLEEIKKECFKKIELEKGELLKQFAERLKDKLEESNFINNGLWLVDTQVLIDETLKEVLGEE